MSGRSAARPAFPVEELAAAVLAASAGRLPARIRGTASPPIGATAPLESAGPGDLAFLANPRYREAARRSRASALVLAPADAEALFANGREGALVVCDRPYAWFAFAVRALHPPPVHAAGLAAAATVDPGARVDPSARVEAGAVVADGARVAAGATIGAGAVVGAGVEVGIDTWIGPRVVLYPGTRIGARAIVHAGAVIGSDGFGFAPLDGAWVKIPQTGRALVGDDVEIGANTTIDRGAMGDTVIEDGVKIDNLVQVGHNCRIGAGTAIAGCVGIAGSVSIGRGCQIGGAAMIAGHLSIADGTVVGGGTLVPGDIERAGFYASVFPLMQHSEWERNAAIIRHLGELRRRLRRLESRLPAGSAADPSGRSTGLEGER